MATQTSIFITIPDKKPRNDPKAALSAFWFDIPPMSSPTNAPKNAPRKIPTAGIIKKPNTTPIVEPQIP